MGSTRPEPEYDAIIVGSGAAGSVAARALTRAGCSVLILEAGRRCGQNATAAELENGRQHVQENCGECRGNQRKWFVDDLQEPYAGANKFLWIRGRGLGGRTQTWWGACPRWTPREFSQSNPAPDRAQWPLAYVEVEPLFGDLERRLLVSAVCAPTELGTWTVLDLRPATAAEQIFRERVLDVLPHANVLPLPFAERTSKAVRTEPGPGPVATDFALDEASQSGRLSIEFETIAHQLSFPADGRRAVGVEVIDAQTSRRRNVCGRSIVLAASAFETVRLLLASSARNSSNRNNNPTLGRFIVDHMMTSAIRFTLPGPAAIPQTDDLLSPGLYLPWQTDIEPPHMPGFQFQVRFARNSANQPLTRLASLRIFAPVVARAENRVTLEPSIRDAWGRPVLRIALRYGKAEAMILDQARKLAERTIRSAGGTIVEARWGPELPGTSAHELGGARMGRSPSTSVVDPWCRLWSAPNVRVVDGSTFVTSGYNNPTLTIMAIAQRAALQLADDLRDGREAASQ